VPLEKAELIKFATLPRNADGFQTRRINFWIDQMVGMLAPKAPAVFIQFRLGLLARNKPPIETDNDSPNEQLNFCATQVAAIYPPAASRRSLFRRRTMQVR
jgi:hypothetical protein